MVGDMSRVTLNFDL